MRETLDKARDVKYDEFFTLYNEIESEIKAYVDFNKDVFRDKVILCPCDAEWSNFTKYFINNFKQYGLRQLICVAYANDYNTSAYTKFETESPNFNKEKHKTCGRVVTVTKDNDSYTVDFNYLEGDGDFRSDEVSALRDKSDIVITNPPFSLFRKFLKWVVASNKKYILLGNMNAITYKDVYELIERNELWLGYRWLNIDMYFDVLDEYKEYLTHNRKEKSSYRIIDGDIKGRGASVCWFTNIPHIKHIRPMALNTMEYNLRNNKRLINYLKKNYGVAEYQKYDNMDGIDIPFVDAIPSDFDGVMGVPMTYLDKHDKDKYDLIRFRKGDDGKDVMINGKSPYSRILIKRK